VGCMLVEEGCRRAKAALGFGARPRPPRAGQAKAAVLIARANASDCPAAVQGRPAHVVAAHASDARLRLSTAVCPIIQCTLHTPRSPEHSPRQRKAFP
jgi:hypothetical protein